MAFGPYDAASHAIGRSENLLAASREASLSSTVRGDLRRLALVMAVAALDTYMHRLIADRVFRHDELPSGLAKLSIPFASFLAQVDATGAAARADPHNSRPRVNAKRQLRDRLLRETFQRFEDVSQALAMAGRKRGWDEIGTKLVPTMRPNDIRGRLNEIVMRRNQIVHEGDYQRLDRPQNSKRNGLSYRQAKADIEFVAALIGAIHDVV